MGAAEKTRESTPVIEVSESIENSPIVVRSVDGTFAGKHPFGGYKPGSGRKPDEVVRRCNRLLKKSTYYAAKKLRELCEHPDPNIALRASEKVLDYGRGKATQNIRIEGRIDTNQVWRAGADDLIALAIQAGMVDRLPERLRTLALEAPREVIDSTATPIDGAE